MRSSYYFKYIKKYTLAHAHNLIICQNIGVNNLRELFVFFFLMKFVLENKSRLFSIICQFYLCFRIVVFFDEVKKKSIIPNTRYMSIPMILLLP